MSKQQQKVSASASTSISILNKKYKQFQDKLDDLIDEFAANDDGDMELRDVQPFLVDALKIMQVELESVNRT